MWQRLSIDAKVLSIIGVVTLLVTALAVPGVMELLHLKSPETITENPKPAPTPPPIQKTKPENEEQNSTAPRPRFKLAPLPNAPVPANTEKTHQFVEKQVRTKTFNAAPAHPAAPPAASDYEPRLALTPEEASEHLISKVDPIYPASAKERKKEGWVAVQIEITKEGDVLVKAVRGDPELAEAASAAVKQWKYKPFLVEGKPAFASTTLSIMFSLPKE